MILYKVYGYDEYCRKEKCMFWYSKLLTDEFVNYFSNEDSIYFSVSSKGKLYNDTYYKFRETVNQILGFYNSDSFEESLYCRLNDNEYLYKWAETFYADENRPNFKDVYHNISEVVFNCKADINALSTNELAIGLIIPFASRMGRSSEDEFAEIGRLRKFFLALYKKTKEQL